MRGVREEVLGGREGRDHDNVQQRLAPQTEQSSAGGPGYDRLGDRLQHGGQIQRAPFLPAARPLAAAQRYPEGEEHCGDRHVAYEDERFEQGPGQGPAGRGHRHPGQRSDRHRVTQWRGQPPDDRHRLPGAAEVEDGQGQRGNQDLLEEQHRRDERSVPEDVDGDGDAQISGIDVAGAQRADRDPSGLPVQEQPGHHDEDPACGGRCHRRDQEALRQDDGQVRAREHREEQGRGCDVEGESGQHGAAVLSQIAAAPYDVPDGDDGGDHRESGEDSLHVFLAGGSGAVDGRLDGKHLVRCRTASQTDGRAPAAGCGRDGGPASAGSPRGSGPGCRQRWRCLGPTLRHGAC
ncbi:hypothetical protein SMICM17S_13245 [Streptomyces microflavus]